MKDFWERVKKKWSEQPSVFFFSSVGVLIMVMMIYYAFFYCDHQWQEATCTTPRTCALCGKTEGEPLGHSWQEATCTTPQICTVCRTIEGNPLGHTWQEATCTAPKTCATCHVTEGEPLPHSVKDWEIVMASTCAQAGVQTGVCDVCKQTIEETLPKLEHTPGDWQITEVATVDHVGKKAKICTVCGETVETESYLSPEDEVKISLENLIRHGDYTSTRVSRISINENLGTAEGGDYVALVYLEWGVKNDADLTEIILEMYSSDLAARIGTDIFSISELAVFWVVPYYSADLTALKCSYSRSGDKMYITDVMSLL